MGFCERASSTAWRTDISGSDGGNVVVGADAFVAATVRLAGNPGLIRHMGRRAHEGMARLSPERVIREFETLLRELAEERDHGHDTVAVHA